MVGNVEIGVVSEPVEIRAHHLLCIQGFQGHGYSKDFTTNMAKIVHKLRDNPSTFLKIVRGADSICRYCPHLSNGTCYLDPISESRIKVMDNLLLQYLEINHESLVSWNEIKTLTKNLSPRTIKKICANCFWKNKCLYFQKRVL
ncbi:MAG: DUF1284 domain-containing protein [Methanobacteriaceae archaeon]|nr:DUF1284 domain-containing protein [Methanobacteriaceae archaeon]